MEKRSEEERGENSENKEDKWTRENSYAGKKGGGKKVKILMSKEEN